MYKLTKQKAVDPRSDMVRQGDSIVGTLQSEPVVGKRLLVSNAKRYINTSIVKAIEDHPTEKNVQVITTTYSIYHLEKMP